MRSPRRRTSAGAHGIAQAGDTNRAERLLGEALAIGHWLVPLPVLGAAHPESVREVLDHDTMW